MSLVKPYSEQSERAVIGVMLLNRDKVSHCVSALTVDDFYNPVNKTIFEAICSLYNEKKSVDLTNLTSKLNDLDKLNEVGGVNSLVEYVNGVVDNNVSYYIDDLKDKTNLRRMSDFIEDKYKGFNEEATRDIKAYMDSFEEEALAITRCRSVSDFTTMDKLIADYNALIAGKDHFTTGVPSGYKYLDEVLNGGWEDGNLIILGARPGMGKTALGLNFAINAAERGIPVAFFSLEMTNKEIIQRMISISGRLDSKKVINGKFDGHEDLIRLDGSCNKLRKYPIYIDDTAGIQLTDLVAKVRKLKGENPSLGLIIVDYLQLVEVSYNKGISREREVAKVATALKNLAKDINVPVIALAQVGRRAAETSKTGQNSNTKERRPELQDLRESGQIEQDADIVLFMYKETYYAQPEGVSSQVEEVELIVAKNRHGEKKIIYLTSTPSCYCYDSKMFIPKPNTEGN